MSTTLNGKHISDQVLRPIRTIVLDWYDGPLGGVLLLGDGRVFQFAHDEDSIYVLSPLPVDAFERTLDAITELGPPKWPIWVPIWRFATTESEMAADAAIDAVLTGTTGESIRVPINFDITPKQHGTYATA